MIVDTNALSAFAEGLPEVRDLIASSNGPYLPVVVVGEYRFGLLGSRQRIRRLAWLDELTKYWNILEISAETARHYADIRHKLKQHGDSIPSNDT